MVLEILGLERLLTSIPAMLALMVVCLLLATIFLCHSRLSSKCKRLLTLFSYILQGIAVLAFTYDARLMLYQREYEWKMGQLPSYTLDFLTNPSSPYFLLDDTLAKWAATEGQELLAARDECREVDTDKIKYPARDTNGPRGNYFNSVDEYIQQYNSIIAEAIKYRQKKGSIDSEKTVFLFMYPFFFLLSIFLSLIVWLDESRFVGKRREGEQTIDGQELS